MLANIVFVGAGGTGMSSLACLLFDLGYHNIVCIDAVDSRMMQKLRAKGIKKVIIGHGNYSVQNHDMVIYSDIPSIIEESEVSQSRIYQQSPTKKHFHICISYNQFIAEISKRFVTVAVAGSNGKTSTTGMLIYALACGQKDQSESSLNFGLGIVGGLMPNFGQEGYLINNEKQEDIKHLFEHILNQKHQMNYSLLKKYIFVIEACEYKDHFLFYDVDYALITNTERDHTDYFLSEEDYRTSFKKFIHGVKNQVIIPKHSTIDYLEQDAHKIVRSEIFPFFSDYLVGKYHESNAGMVAKFLELYDKTKDYSIDLSERKGMGRRMELIYRGDNESYIYSDYSHHAPAIAGNIEAIQKKFPDYDITIIFQPHQAKRILVGRYDFAQALAQIKNIIIYKLYTARESIEDFKDSYIQTQGIQSFDELGEKFARHVGGKYITTLSEYITQTDTLSDNSVLVFFSAGDGDEAVRNIV